MLYVRIILDAIFIALNLNRISLKKLEIYFLLWIAVSVLMGLLYLGFGDYNYKFDRLLKDSIPPILFFLKVLIAKSFLEENSFEPKFIVIFSIIISIYQLLLFYLINASQYVYVGLTPPTNGILAGSMAYSSLTLFLTAFVLILLAGKRAYLISMAALWLFMFAVGNKFLRQKNPYFFSKITLAVTIVTAIGLLFGVQTHTTTKFQDTLSVLQTSKSTSIIQDEVSSSYGSKFSENEKRLYLATAGRSGEFFEILESMTITAWVFGHGSGFTYNLRRPDKETLFGHANSHFSPLGLAYKFGVPFMILFYVWLIYPLIKNSYPCKEHYFWAGILILLLFQSFFAFNLFVEFLFPIAIAAMQAKKR